VSGSGVELKKQASNSNLTAAREKLFPRGFVLLARRLVFEREASSGGRFFGLRRQAKRDAAFGSDQLTWLATQKRCRRCALPA
jgi:hypothetical protein